MSKRDSRIYFSSLPSLIWLTMWFSLLGPTKEAVLWLGSRKKKWLHVQQSRVWSPVLLTIIGQLFHLSQPQLPHLQWGKGVLNDTMDIKCRCSTMRAPPAPGFPFLLMESDWGQQTENTPVTGIGCNCLLSSLHHLDCCYTSVPGSGKCTASDVAKDAQSL